MDTAILMFLSNAMGCAFTLLDINPIITDIGYNIKVTMQFIETGACWYLGPPAYGLSMPNNSLTLIIWSTRQHIYDWEWIMWVRHNHNSWYTRKLHINWTFLQVWIHTSSLSYSVYNTIWALVFHCTHMISSITYIWYIYLYSLGLYYWW